MLKHDGKAFYGASTALGMTRVHFMGELSRHPVGVEYRPANVGSGPLQHLDTVASCAESLKLRFVVNAARRLKADLSSSPATISWAELNSSLLQLERLLLESLESTYLLYLDEDEAALFDPPMPLLPADFATKFGAANSEISEAAKCLALGRDTACAFHSLRALEAGMLAMTRCLSIPDPVKGAERNWGVYLRKIKEQMDLRWPSSARMSGDGEFFENAYAALAAMQNPWRNATMHLDQNYQRDDATDILEAIKRFMLRLSQRMDENGEPKA